MKLRPLYSKWCHVAFVKAKGPLFQATPDVVRLVLSLEWLFQHGLKERSQLTNLSNQLLDLTKGKIPTVQSPALTFWPAIERVLGHQHLDFRNVHIAFSGPSCPKLTTANTKITVRKPPFDESEVERCRAFFRLALNEGTLHSYFSALVSDQRLLQQYYGPTAVFAVSVTPHDWVFFSSSWQFAERDFCFPFFQDQSHCEVLRTLLFSLQDITFQLPMIGFDLSPEEEDNPDLDLDEDELGEKVTNEMPSLGVPAQVRLIVRSMFFVRLLFLFACCFLLMSSLILHKMARLWSALILRCQRIGRQRCASRF